MNPYTNPPIRGYVREFLGKYFSDNCERVLILGINPGRFGAGVTGVTFTDPVALAEECGISNDLPRRRELSSVFVYNVINQLGGPNEFNSRFFLSAVCPLGFTRDRINLNYNDDRKLERAVTVESSWTPTSRSTGISCRCFLKSRLEQLCINIEVLQDSTSPSAARCRRVPGRGEAQRCNRGVARVMGKPMNRP